MEKIIIDTDPGKDDALAIILLALSNKVTIEAITTVAGNSTIQNVTNNARYVVDLINKNIPIYSGSEKPLAQELNVANVHGDNGLSGVNVLKTQSLSNNAADKIIEIVKANPGQVSIVAIGPETNIALAIKKAPEITKIIKQLVIMGGAISVPGNKNRVAEFNIFVDPEAAEIVFNSGVPIVLIPLDICNATPLFMSDFEKITNPVLKSPIKQMMDPYIKAIAKFEGQTGALVYDALATYFFINPSAYELTPMDVRIESKGDLTRGMSVADKRTWGEKSINTRVVTKLDRERFVTDFISIYNQH